MPTDLDAATLPVIAYADMARPADHAQRRPPADGAPSPLMASAPAFALPLPNLAPDLFGRRHGTAARLTRRLIAAACAGRQGYPFVFEAVRDLAPLLAGGSPHLYVHVPFCRTICGYCPYTKVRFRPDWYAVYRTALLQEMGQYLAQPGTPPVASLYFGGGTPSLAPDLIREVVDLARPRLRPETDLGVEVHPRDATPELLAALRGSGVDRVSLGIESLHDTVLRTLGRGYTGAQAEQAIAHAAAAGFACVDVNLIYAIPGQNPRDTVDDVRRCLALGVDHLSAYPLISFAYMPRGRRVRPGDPAYSARGRATLQQQIAAACREAGFVRTSVWSFARDRAANYTTVTRESYRGFGPGAGSKIDNLFWFNTFSVPAYSATPQPRPAIMMRTSAAFQRLHWFYWQIYRMEIDAWRYRQLFGRSLLRDFGGLGAA